ncbi:MAG: hypothetical protein AB1700_06505 [Bacillota bacterium]
MELATLAVLLVPTHFVLSEEAKADITRFVHDGHVLIGLGGTSGLDCLFGCRDKGPLKEAWVGVERDGAMVSHPVTGGVTGVLHAFGGCLVEVVDPSTRVLAWWLDGERWNETAGWQQAEIGAAVTIRRHGAGWALLVAPDLVHSVLRIQQGCPVHVDGRPPRDGSAPVDDGILKTDDGIVLDYERDRLPLVGTRLFGRPVADEWRELLIRAVLWAARATGNTLPMLWYWPEGLQAVGCLSHDSDMNDPTKAEKLLESLRKLDVLSTWCVLYPGGYSLDFYSRLVRDGHEIALHYDAHTNLGRRSWHEADFQLQLDWLIDATGVRVVSNKNHYFRWEGLTEFYHWLVRRGILSDQSKGPSKMGNTGFPFGGSHPWCPMDEHALRFLDVLETNLHSQDLVLTCPYEFGPAIIDQARLHYGVAHLLFHPEHVDKPGVPEAMSRVVKYGQQAGLKWWTVSQIRAWESARRQVRFSWAGTPDGHVWSVESPVPLKGATIYLFDPAPNIRRSSCAAGPDEGPFGFDALRLVVDLVPGEPRCLAGLQGVKRCAVRPG